ncbi:MAG TPA: hypothetical protein VEW65_14605 [Chryseolinea sp.]|nr:hypothetical protein [Chryseolinea sp.]
MENLNVVQASANSQPVAHFQGSGLTLTNYNAEPPTNTRLRGIIDWLTGTMTVQGKSN